MNVRAYLDAGVATEVEVKLSRMCDTDINRRPRWYVATLANL